MSIKGILSDNSGQGSIEYLLICIGALVVSGIFLSSMKGSISGHNDSIVSIYTDS
ncbi:MAG: class III signal peptide-containing protein [Anaerolineaceae bacterium]|nr:class III signal peptide-containing protein [Anaerolineaceae bacterium]